MRSFTEAELGLSLMQTQFDFFGLAMAEFAHKRKRKITLSITPFVVAIPCRVKCKTCGMTFVWFSWYPKTCPNFSSVVPNPIRFLYCFSTNPKPKKSELVLEFFNNILSIRIREFLPDYQFGLCILKPNLIYNVLSKSVAALSSLLQRNCFFCIWFGRRLLDLSDNIISDGD